MNNNAYIKAWGQVHYDLFNFYYYYTLKAKFAVTITYESITITYFHRNYFLSIKHFGVCTGVLCRPGSEYIGDD